MPNRRRLLQSACLTIALACTTARPAAAATFTVINANDSGAGSLRAAIDSANGSFGADTIEFNIPGGGFQTIALDSDLPAIFDQVLIDGFTQPGASAATNPSTVRIEITGGAVTLTNGLVFTSDPPNCEVRGLLINDCTNANIFIESTTDVEIYGCWLGVNQAGTATVGNPDHNILTTFFSDNLLIGDEASGMGNVIGGGDVGIEIVGSDVCRIVNNRLGTITGAENLGFTAHGINLLPFGESTCDEITIGTVSGPNIIANCGLDGIVVEDFANLGATQSPIRFNRIFNFGGLAIDLGDDGQDLNDDGDPDNGANRHMNFPVLESAVMEGANLRVRGWVRAESTVQIYQSTTAAGSFGNLRTLIASLDEGSGSDLDATTSAYVSPINGINQGAETTSRFEFLIGPVALAGGDRLAATATPTEDTPSGDCTSEVSGNVTILGAAAACRFVQQPTNAVAGVAIAPSITVELIDGGGARVVQDDTSQITLSINNNPGGSTLSGTLTQTVTDGLATFPGISLDRSGTGYTLDASSAGLTSDTSDPFDITAAAADHLAFGQQPTNSPAGVAIDPAVTVRVEDAFGNLVGVTGTAITVAIGNNPGGGTLSGTLTQNTTAGLATFSDVSIELAGVGYTLTASATGLTGATSNAFDINAAPSARVVFAQQPTDTVAGAAISPAVTVRIEDSFGNLVDVTGTPVTLAIGNNPSAGTLSGTLTQNSNGGLATFADLSIDLVGTGYTLTAASAGLTGATSNAFNITAGAAARLAFGQQPTNTTAGAAIAPAVTVRVEDAFGNLVDVTGTAITLAIGNNPSAGTLSGTATQNTVAGVATFANLSLDRAGVGYTLTAASTGLTGATSNAFDITAGAAARLAFVQQPTDTTAGAAITPAVTVRVEDAFGNLVGVTGTAITLAIGNNPSGGTLSGTATQNTAGGLATFNNLSLDRAGVGYTLTAASAGLTGATSSGFNITAGAAAWLAFVQGPTDTVAGVAITPAVTVRIEDDFGNLVVVNGTPITLAIVNNPSGGTLAGTLTQNSAGGIATFADLSIDLAGTGYTLGAGSPGLNGDASVAFNILAGPAARLAFVQQPTDTAAGAAITPAVSVRLEDAFGNAVTTAGTAITLAIGTNPSGGTLSGTATQATVAGVATFAGLSIDLAGTGYTLTAAATGLAGATSTAFDITAGPAARLAFVQQPSNAMAGAAIAPAVTVRLEDAEGNAVNADGMAITLAIGANPAAGTLSGTLTQNTVAGVATFAGLSIDRAGTGYTLTAASTGLTGAVSAAFDIAALPATRLAFVQQPTNTLAGATIAPAVTVRLEDAGGNLVPTDGTSITLAIDTNPAAGTLSGTLTRSTVGGVATFDDLSIDRVGTGYTLQAAGGELTAAISNGFDILAAGANRLAFVQQPTDTIVGQSIAPAVSVRIEDDGGTLVNVDGTAITLSIGANPAGGTLAGTLTRLTVGGVATFAGLSLDRVGAGYTLAAAGTGLVGAASSPFDILAAPAVALAFVQQPTDRVVNQPIAPAVTVRLEDAGGTLVATDGVAITLALGANPGGGTLAGTLTQTTTAGVATFAGLSLDQAGVGYTLVASSGALTADTSDPFTILGLRLAIVQQPTDALAGATIAPAVTVRIEDTGGNVVATDGVAISLAIGANPGAGTLAGTLTQTTTAGVATFADLSLDLAGVGYTLVASSAGLADATSNAFTILGVRLAFVQQPTDALANATIAPAVTVRLEDTAGNPLATEGIAITVAVGANPGGGTLAGTLTQTTTAGVATFADLSLDLAGVGYTLVASSPGLGAATSNAFTILGLRLAFVQQPTDALANATIAPPVTVRLEDTAGNPLATDGVAISLAVGANPATGTLAGTLTRTTTAGVATFADLSLDLAGVGYTLVASSPGLGAATSNAFTILGLRLVFAQQPTNAIAGATIAPAVTVRLEDTAGTLQATDGESITLALGANPAAGTLAGTLTRTTTAGVATFADLSLDNVGAGYTLAANHATATAAASDPFDIVLAPVGSSTLSAAPQSLPADGTSLATLTITLLDGAGQPLAGIAASRLSLSAAPADGVTLTQPTLATDANGQTTATAGSTVPATVTFALLIDGADSGQTAEVSYFQIANLAVSTDVYFIGFPVQQGAGSPRETLGADGAWRMVRWDQATNAYVPYNPATDGENPAFFFPRGTGHYVRWDFARTLQLAGTPPNTELAVPLTVGWTTLANPFTAVFPWTLEHLTIRETASGNVLGTLADRGLWDSVRPYAWSYNRETQTHELVYPGLGATDEVDVYEGFWMFALRPGLEVVLTPPSTEARSRRRQAAPTASQWTAEIVAASGEQRTNVVVGVDGQLTRALPIDAAPAPDQGGLELRVVTPAGRYAGQLDRPSNRLQWELAATSAEGGPVTLSWPNIGRGLPQGLLLSIEDRQTGQRTALNGRASYSYTAVPGQERRFLLTAEPFGNQRTTITDLRAATSRAAGSQLSLTLSGPATITVTIRGLGGRIVRTLQEEAAEAGTIVMAWDGRDAEGRAVPAGTYRAEAVAEGPLGLSHRVIRTIVVQ